MMLRVTFQGAEYVLTNGDLIDGPLATTEQFQAGLPSFAHLFPDGNVRQYNVIIGTVQDIVVLGEIADLETNADFFENLLGKHVDGHWS